MKQKQYYLFGGLIILALSGCGLKGPLYMPGDEPQQESRIKKESPTEEKELKSPES